jgi:hypothetical protein
MTILSDATILSITLDLPNMLLEASFAISTVVIYNFKKFIEQATEQLKSSFEPLQRLSGHTDIQI